MPNDKVENLKQELGLLNIEDIINITGWAEATVKKLMEDDEFPTLKIGKNNQVQFEAFKEYLMHRRIKRGNND